jgi:glycosyltransferase involved in cell wall biosynthesis
MEPRISVVINTLNEERNLPYALRSVRSWADEIVVVDMYSDDHTVEIARQFGAKVYSHRRVGFVEPARAFAVSQATGDWVLILDADELTPRPLSRKLIQISQSETVDVVKVPYLNYIFGAPLMYSGCGPSQAKHMRFFRRGSLHTTPAIHDYFHPVPGARVLELPYEPGHSIVHFAYLDAVQWVEKMNRYTSIEAEQRFERREHASPFKALIHTMGMFLWMYIRRQGYRDGWRGFYYSALSGFYRLVTLAKLQGLERIGARARVEEVYRHDAERLLDEYGKARTAVESRP